MSENRPPSKRFQDVLVWQKAHAWAVRIYRLTRGFPKEERYEMTAQLRDAAVSVSNNFAEGFKRRATKDKLRFYNISQASLEESRNLLLLARSLGYGETARLLSDADEIARMLNGYVGGIIRQKRTGRPLLRPVPNSPY